MNFELLLGIAVLLIVWGGFAYILFKAFKFEKNKKEISE
jgi:hypothetical protein